MHGAHSCLTLRLHHTSHLSCTSPDQLKSSAHSISSCTIHANTTQHPRATAALQHAPSSLVSYFAVLLPAPVARLKCVAMCLHLPPPCPPQLVAPLPIPAGTSCTQSASPCLGAAGQCGGLRRGGWSIVHTRHSMSGTLMLGTGNDRMRQSNPSPATCMHSVGGGNCTCMCRGPSCGCTCGRAAMTCGETMQRPGHVDLQAAQPRVPSNFLNRCSRSCAKAYLPICAAVHAHAPARVIISPSISSTRRSTPCAAGCCGPKFSVKLLTF